MIVQIFDINPIWTLFTVVGILTLFGKKKKDEQETETGAATASAPTTIPPSQPTTTQPPPAPFQTTIPASPSSPPVNTYGSYPPQRSWSPPPVDEDSSLSRLLQSLLKDLPPDESTIGVEPSNSFSMTSPPEWVPPRATPASRPMVIAPTGKKSSESERTSPPSPATFAPQPLAPSSRPMKPTEDDEDTEAPASTAKVVPQTPEKAEKPDKQDKAAKQESPKRPSPPKAFQNFDHIFELTQGSFDSPGLVVINGAIGSGKTTLCSGLADSFLKQGNPCMYVTYDKAPGTLRDQMKKMGFDPSVAESSYRFLLVDGFASQSDSFSFEPYYVEKAFDFDSIQDALVKNSSMFIGEKTKILFDSIDQLVAKTDSKDLVKDLGETLNKLKDSNITLVVTLDLSKAPKDIVKWLEDTAACVIDLDKDDSDPNGRELKVRKLNGSTTKIDTETFEIDSGKGLVFVT